MVVLGGLGNVWGGVLGAVIVTVLYELTRGYYEYQLLMFGIAVVVVVMYMPSGLAGLFARRSAVEKFRRLRQNNVRAA
jgi:branched-chain amino acid transport system permease protein